MATYKPEDLQVQAPPEGFSEGGWYGGRQYFGGTLGEAGAIHPVSPQQGAGQMVSPQVQAQSAAQQGVTPENMNKYIAGQAQKGAGATPAPAQASAQGQQGTGQEGQAGQAGEGMAAPATINLPEMYKSLYEGAGISKIEEEYSTKEKQFIEAKGKINDNPFLSEATRVGRVAKLESLFAERTANLQRDIATKKADVETQLNLQTKQFDIESQAAQQAFSQLNTLLGMGALDNASGDTIANLTRSTGIGSDMILSAIEANKKKNVKTQMITSTGENGEMFAVLLDSNTGEIIKKTSLGVIGNVQGGKTEIDWEGLLPGFRDDVAGKMPYKEAIRMYPEIPITEINRYYTAWQREESFTEEDK